MYSCEGVEFPLLPVKVNLQSTNGGHGGEDVLLGREENILRYLTHHCLVAGPQHGGVFFGNVLLLLLGFGLQQVGGVVMAQKFLNHEQRNGVEAHHMCHASPFWTVPEGHYLMLTIRIIFVPITGLLVFFCSGEDIHCIRQDS